MEIFLQGSPWIRLGDGTLPRRLIKDTSHIRGKCEYLLFYDCILWSLIPHVLDGLEGITRFLNESGPKEAPSCTALHKNTTDRPTSCYKQVNDLWYWKWWRRSEWGKWLYQNYLITCHHHNKNRDHNLNIFIMVILQTGQWYYAQSSKILGIVHRQHYTLDHV